MKTSIFFSDASYSVFVTLILIYNSDSGGLVCKLNYDHLIVDPYEGCIM